MVCIFIVGLQGSPTYLNINPRLSQSGLLNTSEYKCMYTGTNSELTAKNFHVLLQGLR